MRVAKNHATPASTAAARSHRSGRRRRLASFRWPSIEAGDAMLRAPRWSMRSRAELRQDAVPLHRNAGGGRLLPPVRRRREAAHLRDDLLGELAGGALDQAR